MKLPVLIVSLLLCLPCCWAGGICPSKMELKTCTCRHLKLKTDLTHPPRRRRRDIPSEMTMSLTSTSYSTHPAKTTHTSTSLSKDSNRPTTQPTTTGFSHSETTHFTLSSEDFSPTDKTMSPEESTLHITSSEDFSPTMSSEESTDHTPSSDGSSDTDNTVSSEQSTDGSSDTDNTVSSEQSTDHSSSSDSPEIQGRRMGNHHTTDDEFEDYSAYQLGQVPAVSDSGFLSRSMGAHNKKLPPRMPPYEPSHGTFQLTVVDCKEPKTITEFEEILLFALHRKSVDKLIVSHLPPAKEETLARLPSRGMRNTRIKQFEIRDTALSGDFIWFGNPFEGQANSLLRFAANRCYLYGALSFEEPGTINTKGLNLLPHIEVVDFSINHLTVVKSTAFRFPPANLTSIGLSRNSLQTLEPGCFQNVTNLRIVDLSHNLLKVVARAIFSVPAKFLETINFSENFLEILPLDFFVNMPALKHVNLARNFLHNMPEKPWITVWRQLMYVDITGNFMYCDCNLLWLLSVLSPIKENGTINPSPVPLPGQTIRGTCTYNRMPNYIPVQYSLVTLTRDMLMC